MYFKKFEQIYGGSKFEAAIQIEYVDDMYTAKAYINSILKYTLRCEDLDTFKFKLNELENEVKTSIRNQRKGKEAEIFLGYLEGKGYEQV